MAKVEFIEYRGRKLPLSLTIGCLITYKESTGKDFEEALQNRYVEKETFDAFLTIFHLMLQKGALIKYNKFTQFIYRLISGNNYGIKSKNLYAVLDELFTEFVLLLPNFYLHLYGQDASTGEKKS